MKKRGCEACGEVAAKVACGANGRLHGDGITDITGC